MSFLPDLARPSHRRTPLHTPRTATDGFRIGSARSFRSVPSHTVLGHRRRRSTGVSSPESESDSSASLQGARSGSDRVKSPALPPCGVSAPGRVLRADLAASLAVEDPSGDARRSLAAGARRARQLVADANSETVICVGFTPHELDFAGLQAPSKLLAAQVVMRGGARRPRNSREHAPDQGPISSRHKSLAAE